MYMKKIISVLLVAVIISGLIVLPASADKSSVTENDYPFVFVHGLFGWGERAGLNDILPYWGMTTGSFFGYLQSKGCECYAATMGPLSSAWDRACELYAQLTGTTVDYGIAHSAEKGHDRFGITYDEPLFEGWGSEKKINLIGHSFGGATIRLFLDILADGCPEEAEAARAAGVEVSPFFEGGKADWVYSLTAISAPHNGTTFFDACQISANTIPRLFYDALSMLGMSEYKGMYDLQLEHFGVSRMEGETDCEFLSRVLCSEKFMSHNDNALYDLMIDNALAINDGIEIRDDVYYFSVTGDTTCAGKCGTRIPTKETLILVSAFSTLMGRYCNSYTDGGVYIDESWLPNDGLVNVVSGLYPKNSELECVKPDGSQGYVICDENTKSYEKGIWNVLPVQPYDHVSIVGGLLSNSAENVRIFYGYLIDTITSTYSAPQTGHGWCMSPLFKFVDHTKWPQVFLTAYKALSWVRTAIKL